MRLARGIGGGESASVRARWHRGFIRLKHRTSFSRQPVFSMVGFGRGKMTTTIEEHYRTLIPGLGALLDFLGASHVRAVAFLVAICLVSYLPGFFNIPPVDRDEARFVQATKQMIESGDYVDIRFQEEVRYKKPVGIYWLQAAAVRAAEGLGASDPRTTIWLYRLPSLIGAIGAVLLTYWTALAFGTRRTAYLSALMLACSLLLGVEARLAKTDAMLLLTVVAAFGALARAYLAAPEAPMDRRTWLVPAMFWVTFWPAAPLAAVAASRVWQHHREPATQFLLAWLVPAWLLFELVPTKLPHYVLPLYPAIAILIARTMAQGGLSHDRRLVRANILWPAVTVMLPIAAVIAVVVLRRQLGLLAWPFSAAAMIFGFLAWRFYETDGAERSLLRAAVAAIMLSVAVPGAIVPLLRPLFPSALLAYNVHPDCERPLYASAGYHEPSLVFLFGTSTRLTDGQGAADFLLEGGCRFAFIEARHERAFVQRAEAIGLRYAPGPRVEAINETAGHSFSIAIYRSEGR